MVLVPGEVRDMPGLSSGGIFLSYRRQDAAPYARLLKSQLSDRFPDADVFMDLDSMKQGWTSLRSSGTRLAHARCLWP